MTDNGSSEDFKPSSTDEGLGLFGKKLKKNVGDRECSSPFKYATTLNEINEPVINDLRSLIVSGYLAKHCYFGKTICEEGKIETTEITAGKVPSEKIFEQKSNLLQEINSDFPQVDLSSRNDSDENQDLKQNFDQVTKQDEKLTTMVSPMQTKECKQFEATAWSNQNLLENTSLFPVISADTKSNWIDNTNGASQDVKFNDGTFTSDLEPRNISIAGNKSEVTNQQSAPTPIGTGNEELRVGGTQSLFAHLILEDTSLPEAASLSGPITTSGHIPYSGNISHRSDSSTTSTHSFAFPILQSEWNNSPVRMAKADRKCSRKHRWRTALLCCKF